MALTPTPTPTLTGTVALGTTFAVGVCKHPTITSFAVTPNWTSRRCSNCGQTFRPTDALTPTAIVQYTGP